jgi:hypothetical protein
MSEALPLFSLVLCIKCCLDEGERGLLLLVEEKYSMVYSLLECLMKAPNRP